MGDVGEGGGGLTNAEGSSTDVTDYPTPRFWFVGGMTQRGSITEHSGHHQRSVTELQKVSVCFRTYSN
jgi:hypothetical protein